MHVQAYMLEALSSMTKKKKSAVLYKYVISSERRVYLYPLRVEHPQGSNLEDQDSALSGKLKIVTRSHKMYAAAQHSSRVKSQKK